MAIFNGHVVTNEGRNLLSRALAGEGRFIFTRAAYGAGKYDGNIKELANLVDERLNAPIANIINDRGTAVLKVQITNENLEESFRTEEFGVFAKIEGDSQEILYSYATAIEPDSIPNNSFGNTFEGEHNVSMTLDSDVEAEIYIKEGAIFLTMELANQLYVQTGGVIRGKLAGRKSLEENGQYQADNEKWYLNVGGNREWQGNGVPDEELVEITFLHHEKEIQKKQNKDEPSLPTEDKTILGAIKEIFKELIKKATNSQLGRVIIGDGFNIEEDGTISHKDENSWKHIPRDGKVGEFLKYLAPGTAQWINIKWSDIKEKFSLNAGEGLNITGDIEKSLTINLEEMADEELNTLLNQEILNVAFELASEQDIRNLFAGTRLEGGTEYKLSALSADETKMVNMKLLSLFNDLILQKVGNDSGALKNELTDLINKTKTNLEEVIKLKESKETVAELLKNLKTDLTKLINEKASSSSVEELQRDLNTKIEEKANKNISVTLGQGLRGGGTLENNIIIELETLTENEVTDLV